ncbi:MAG: cohesin domain-containing protein, partial [Candidatus Thermoplasmatota archaeon]|nr:cohesin domain-containing protein [Candidatus Thermoplasmatota archaeon]
MIQLRDSSVKGISFCIIIILLTLFAAASFSLQQTDLMKDSFSETFIESVNEMNSNPIDSGLTYLSIDSVQISIGGEETTSVTITNVVDLAAFQFSLSWDPLVVNIIGVDTSGSLSSVNYYYNNNGILNVNWFNIDGVSKDLLYVLNLTFEPNFSTNEGDWCFLNFSNSLLSDIHLNQIEYIIQNGTTTVIDNKSNNVILKIDSIEIPINGNGSVSVKAYNSQNLAGFQMNITYDPMIITVEEVNDTSSFFNQVHYHIHEELGIISLNSFNITGFNGDIPLFDILVTPAQGAVVGNNSHLNITDCIMGNADGEYLDFLI